MNRIVALALVAGCGRIAFDPRADGGGDGAPADAAPSAIEFVQAKGDGFGDAQTGMLAWPQPVVAGNLLLVGIDYDTLAANATISDTLGSTWHMTTPTDGFDRQMIAYAIAAASGADTVTVTLDAKPVTFFELRVHEYRGVSPSAPLDNQAGSAGDTIPVTVEIATHAPGQMVFAMGIMDTAVLGSAGPGYTLRLNFANDVTEDRIVETPQTLPAVVTYSGFANWTVTAVVLSPG